MNFSFTLIQINGRDLFTKKPVERLLFSQEKGLPKQTFSLLYPNRHQYDADQSQNRLAPGLITGLQSVAGSSDEAQHLEHVTLPPFDSTERSCSVSSMVQILSFSSLMVHSSFRSAIRFLSTSE
jgi:hypothetical protein